MKRYLHKYSFLRPICAILLMAAGLLTVRAGTETSVRLYDTSGITLTQEDASDGNTYSRLKWSGLASSSEVGAPELPVEYIRFIVPVYSNNFRATVSNVSATPARQLSTKIIPVQEPVTTNEASSVPFTAPASAAYSSAWPTRAEVVEDGFIDGCNHIVTVAVYPTAYTPALDRLTTATSLTVTLQYDECTAADLTDTPLFPPSRSQYVKLPSLVVNADRVSNRSYAPAIETLDESSRGWYYIIAPENLVDAFDELARWKRQKGYNVQVTSIESIYRRYRPGTSHSCTLANNQSHNVNMVDSAASLRTYLQDEFAKNGSFFCLLAGDWKSPMPIRYVKQYRSSEVSIHTDTFIPTDNYFSDLTSNWELEQTGIPTIYSVYLYGLSYSPDVFIGRLLCSESQDVENYLNKLVIYEANPGLGDNTYLDTAFFYEQNSTSSHINHALPIINICNQPNVVLFQDHSYTGETGAFPTGADVLKQMAKSGYSSWKAHGGAYSIATNQYSPNPESSQKNEYQIYAYRDYKSLPVCSYLLKTEGDAIDDMTNWLYPGIVYSISCTNAPLDWYSSSSGEYKLPNLAQAYTTCKGGGVAFLGNSRPSPHGSSNVEEKSTNPEEVSPGAELECYFNKGLNLSPHIGFADTYSKAQPLKYKSTIKLTYPFLHNLIGEPELEVWLRRPLEMEREVSINNSTISFNQNDTLPFNVSIIVGNQKSKYFTVKSTNTYLIPVENTDYCISVWKTGYLPIITMFAETGSISNNQHSYVVRKGVLGKDGSVKNTYIVDTNGVLKIKALDRIDVYNGLTVADTGKLDLECNQTVYLHGGLVKSGGTLVIKAPNVEFGEGFTVEKGGILQIINR